MKSYSKLFFYVVAGFFVITIFIQPVRAENRTILKNQMTRIGMVRHAGNTVEVFFQSEGRFFYFPALEGENSVTEGGELIRLLKLSKKITLHEFTQPSQGNSTVNFAHYTFEF